MLKSILLIGNNGQVGKELEKILSPQVNLVGIGRTEIDLTNGDSIINAITSLSYPTGTVSPNANAQYKPRIIINAAAYTAVDKAENEIEIATAINETATAIMAETAKKIGASLIHISTDYVFDGNNSQPYSETHPTNPVSVYGKTKLAGEKAIEGILDNYLILRTAWVYGCCGKGNFVKTMLRLGGEREEIRVVADQIGTPTWAKDIANAISSIIQINENTHNIQNISGIYNYTNSGIASWYDFAVAIFEEAENLGFPLKVRRVIPITTAEYPTPANRPAYSVLSGIKISSVLGTYAPHWRQSLRRMLKELIVSG
ncbi:dTDP-4-dehydrorhamnose reductase [Brunnivagina elsteri]|uniref:dTDP-4-dehydrorhamnose reductase n=1 Tax=Brunnivagina elsteri CCALA 953 TaxID=987040 RepID=A0A2A2TQF4_9CYAN|nr:dTDP-4-dehydrorhamnose reductase [Calothrix elsteri]PAX60368.1 dTDP-4-dehydrorhamnose reductase [Calothrix elsteri CCALA 953]